MDHLTQVVLAAQAAGMSYGKYVALRYEQNGFRTVFPAAEAEEEPEEVARCVICGVPMPHARADVKTCGPACRQELNRRRNRERYRKKEKFKPTETYQCAYCGNEFIPNRRYQRFCAVRCQEAHKRAVKRGEIVAAGISPGMENRSYGTGECVICGEMFTKRSARQMTCSAGCRKEYETVKRKEKKC